MKKTLIDSMKFHQTMDTFYNYVPKEMLPLECGGQAGTHQELQSKLYNFVKFKLTIYLYRWLYVCI